MAITVMKIFDAKNRENKNLILAIILCRNFIFKGTSTLVLFTRKDKKIKFIVSLAN